MEFKTKIKRRIMSFKEFLFNKNSRNLACKKLIEILYSKSCLKKHELKKISIEDFLGKQIKVTLSSQLPRNGNMSLEEILVICSIVKTYQPKSILEIGTFNGLTTLNMALNSPVDTKINTLDLDPHSLSDCESLWDEDLKFIFDKEKNLKAFSLFKEKNKITEHIGNSLTYDFSRFHNTELIFIDGGHSHDIVASDTAKSLEILAPKGILIWHDYSCHSEDVFNFLNQLKKKIPLVNIEGTSLVIYKKS